MGSASCWLSSWSVPANTSSTSPDPVGPGPAVGLDQGVEERPQRRVGHRDRRAAPLRAAGRATRGSHRGDAAAGRPLRRPHRAAHPGGLPAACRVAGAHRWWRTPAALRRPGRQAAARRPPRRCRRHRTQTPRPRAAGRCPPPRSRASPPQGTGSPTPSTPRAPTLLEVHGVGPIVAAFILGHVGDPARFATRGPLRRPTTGPPPSKRPADRGSGTGSTPRQPQAQPRHAHPPSPRSATTPRAAPTRPQDRRREVEEGSAARTQAPHQRRRLAATPSRPRPPLTSGPGRTTRDDSSHPAWPAEP